MENKSHFYTAFQGFLVGALLMAYVADYNREQLPFALLALILSFLCRFASGRY